MACGSGIIFGAPLVAGAFACIGSKPALPLLLLHKEYLYPYMCVVLFVSTIIWVAEVLVVCARRFLPSSPSLLLVQCASRWIDRLVALLSCSLLLPTGIRRHHEARDGGRVLPYLFHIGSHCYLLHVYVRRVRSLLVSSRPPLTHVPKNKLCRSAQQVTRQRRPGTNSAHPRHSPLRLLHTQ